MESMGPRLCGKMQGPTWKLGPCQAFCTSFLPRWPDLQRPREAPKRDPVDGLSFFLKGFFLQNSDLKSGWGNMLNNASPQIFWESWSLKYFFFGDLVFSNLHLPLETWKSGAAPQHLRGPQGLTASFWQMIGFQIFCLPFLKSKNMGLPPKLDPCKSSWIFIYSFRLAFFFPPKILE